MAEINKMQRLRLEAEGYVAIMCAGILVAMKNLRGRLDLKHERQWHCGFWCRKCGTKASRERLLRTHALLSSHEGVLRTGSSRQVLKTLEQVSKNFTPSWYEENVAAFIEPAEPFAWINIGGYHSAVKLCEVYRQLA